VDSTPDSVRIHYQRLPGRLQTFEQKRVANAQGCAITLLESADIATPMTIEGRVALEPGAPIVWFTFDGAWHDIGRFHDADGRFTGFYANVLTPVMGLDGNEWRTTDLFLDVWLRSGVDAVAVLDRDEFEEARARGWIDNVTAERALEETSTIERLHAAGAWPPAIAFEWPIERARAAVE
jgi:predicted RNA-binding protein associated with RNAse of E/G family